MVHKNTEFLIVEFRQHTLSTKYDEYYEKEVPNTMGGLMGALTQSGEDVRVRERPLYSLLSQT